MKITLKPRFNIFKWFNFFNLSFDIFTAMVYFEFDF